MSTLGESVAASRFWMSQDGAGEFLPTRCNGRRRSERTVSFGILKGRLISEGSVSCAALGSRKYSDLFGRFRSILGAL